MQKSWEFFQMLHLIVLLKISGNNLQISFEPNSKNKNILNYLMVINYKINIYAKSFLSNQI